MPAVADTEVQAEALQFLAQSMLSNNRGGKKGDTRIYWKRPLIDPATGKKDDAPGWIIWASADTTSTSFMDSFMLLHRTPLPQYGIVQQYTVEDCIGRINKGELPPNHPDQYGIFGRILTHPKGPAEFPVEQILAYGWYDPDRCPVPGVKFPQLEGLVIVVYDCPECTNKQYAEPVHLARHLRNTHNWDWQDIAAYGEEQGIIFQKERPRGARGRVTFDFTSSEFAEELARAAEAEESVAPEPVVKVQHVQTRVRRTPKQRRGDMTPEQKEHLRQAALKAWAIRRAKQAAKA